VIIRRYQAETGREAILEATGETFTALAARRTAPLARTPGMPFAARERGVAGWQRRAEMPDRKNSGTSDYVVGYRRPPKATQFAAGKSGMGSFYRSRHELIFAFKNGVAPHLNSFELGQHGRYRTNVWEYRGVNTLKSGRLEELALHPTVKPVAMIVDAIKDVSRRAGIVLDLFGGSGSSLIAAHKTGRRARVCEFDPVYCDRILHRWETFAKDD
jgi:hypothetical protein